MLVSAVMVHRRKYAHMGLHLPRLEMPTPHQPDLRPRQTVPHRHHTHGPKVGHHWPLAALFDRAAVPPPRRQRLGHGTPHFGLGFAGAKVQTAGLAAVPRPRSYASFPHS